MSAHLLQFPVLLFAFMMAAFIAVLLPVAVHDAMHK
ncbi:MAG: hypothetical protein RLZZ58_1623 [Pseudomonadota bacterium]|jgi:fatty acid desaturase